jgi:uncharacterized protein (DUF1684 family)
MKEKKIKGFIRQLKNDFFYDENSKRLWRMQKILITVSLLITAINVHPQSTYPGIVQAHRDSINLEFSNLETSILTQEDLAHFHGLSFYSVDAEYRVKAKFKKIKNGQPVKMPTTGSRTPSYRPYGTLKFKLKGKKCTLTLYQNAEPNRPELKNYLLLAFTDLTSGFDTYGGGRYLDFSINNMYKEVIIDFNYCYNPYCAYSDKYSCVIPPLENHLPIKIEAGVKKFHD